jgi:hypothetical protein
MLSGKFHTFKISEEQIHPFHKHSLFIFYSMNIPKEKIGKRG